MNVLKNSIKLPTLQLGGSTSSYTEPPVPPAKALFLTKRRKDSKRLNEVAKTYHSTLGKKRNVEGSKEMAYPTELLGRQLESMSETWKTHPELTGPLENYSKLLQVAGSAMTQIAQYTEELVENIGSGFVMDVESNLEAQQDLSKAIKDAEKQRETLDSSISKAAKAKSPNGTEQETEDQQAEYETVCEEIRGKVVEMESGISRDAESLKQLLQSQLDFSLKCTEILRKALDSTGSPVPSFSHVKIPALPPRTRSNTLIQESLLSAKISTRASRSHSDSSRQEPASDTSSIGSKKPSVFSLKEDKSKPVGEQSRSRSGSVRDSITSRRNSIIGALGGGGGDKKETRSRSGSILSKFTTPKRPASATNISDKEFVPEPVSDDSEKGFSRPTMPTLASIKKLASNSPKYSNLDEVAEGVTLYDDDQPLDRRASLKRHATEPALASLLSNTPTSSNDPQIGATYRAQWAYIPSDSNELHLERGEKVVLKKVINEDWWFGINDHKMEGMFPCTYVVFHDATARRAPPPPPARRLSTGNVLQLSGQPHSSSPFAG